MPAAVTLERSESRLAIDKPGRARLRVAKVFGRSVVTAAYASSPVRLLAPRNHGPGAWIYTSTFGGGLVDGDCIDLDIEVEPGALAFLSTQSSTKVYRSPSTGTTATLSGRVGPDALLVVVPDPVVCFAGARYRQIQRFDVAEGGSLVSSDAIVAGRCASGERWAFDLFYNRTEVRVGGRLLLYDPVMLRSREGDIAARMGRYDVLATIVAVGPETAALRRWMLAGKTAEGIGREGQLLMAASPLADDGCIVRLMGRSIAGLRTAVRSLLGGLAVRLGDDPWSRKW